MGQCVHCGMEFGGGADRLCGLCVTPTAYAVVRIRAALGELLRLHDALSTSDSLRGRVRDLIRTLEHEVAVCVLQVQEESRTC